MPRCLPPRWRKSKGTHQRLTEDLRQNRIFADLHKCASNRNGLESAAIYRHNFLLKFSKWLQPGPRGYV
jgi:predicted deacetylase